MKRILPVILILTMLAACAGTGGTLSSDSGTFRGKWYNYYNRGLAYSELSDWDRAEKDLKRTILKRPEDQRMARTYGMHFIDYFPHRELGIIYLNKGDIDRAVSELETSLGQSESAKAVFYLNRARKMQLMNMDIRPSRPELVIQTPLDGEVMNDFRVKVAGTVSGKGYVSRIRINDMPLRVDLARKNISFEKEISLEEGTANITVVAEDLLGNMVSRTLTLRVDRDGPTINIFDIVSEPVNGHDGIRVTGEVHDSSGMGSLAINGIVKSVHMTKNYEFDVLMADKGATDFVIEAADILNNRTSAEMDIAKELEAWNRDEEPVLLALNADSLFSLDEKPPTISLKESTDIPTVFVDKYYVEAEVSDNKGVEQIEINGKGVESRKGRKIFFSKVMGLEEGVNNINIDAYDSAGNKSHSDIAVKRDIPAALQVGSRMSVSVLPFDLEEKEIPLAELAYEQLIGSFVDQKRFSVIERAKLEAVLREQQLTRENLTDTSYSIEVGRIMSADTVLATRVSETDSSIEFIARVINTETSEVMDVKDVYSEDKSFSTVKKLMEGLASKVASSFPLVKGLVIKRDSKVIFTDLGMKEKIKRDMGVIVYRMGEEVIHPLTGKSLGADTTNLGEARFASIHEGFSKAELTKKTKPEGIKVMDLVITK